VPRRRLAVLIAALALAAPGTAFAQSAGDEQYQDPFGDDQAAATPTPTPTPAPSGSTTTPAAPAAPASTPAPAPAPAVAASQQLPRTGNDPITPAVAGFWLLLGGVALRAKVRPR